MADLGFADPLLVWGLFPRLVGVVFLISFLSLRGQVVALAGPDGAVPLELRLRKLRDAFPLWRCLVHYPTFFWISCSATMMRAHIWVGLACSVAVIFGGPVGWWGLLGCYLIYVSLDRPLTLIFPWDSLLFELAFLGLFLPQWSVLPEVAATQAPAPLLVWAFRIVVFRVMFGFGKAKFASSNKDDWGYLTGFLANQPLPSKIAWYMHKLPLWMLKIALFIMFICEIPIPLLVFHSELAVIAGAAFIALMLAIWGSGSFGYFSLAMIVACVTLFDTQTPQALEFGALFSSDAPLFTNAVVSLHLVGAALAFPFNSWVSQHWHSWAVFDRLPRWLTWPLDFYALVHALRWVHPYGVFPPKTQPGVRTVPVIEVSWDGETWKELEFPLASARPHDAPRFISPHHARGDQSIIYETFGLNAQSYLMGVTCPGDPTVFTSRCGARPLLQRILEGKYYPGVFTRKGDLDPNRPPPRFARVRTFVLRPTTLEEKRETGAWWKRGYIGPHSPVVEKDDDFWTDFLSEPELFHPAMTKWRSRSRIRSLAERGARTEPVDDAIVADSTELSLADMKSFWEEFIPAVRLHDRKDWDGLRALRTGLLRRFGRVQLRQFERIVGRLCVYGSGRIDPFFLRRGLRPPLRAKNYMWIWMAMQDAVYAGPAAFEAVIREPRSLQRHLDDLDMADGLFFHGLFRYEAMVFEAQKLRLLRSYVFSHQRPKTAAQLEKEEKARPLVDAVTTFADVFDFLEDKFVGAPFDEGFPESYPRYTANAGVVRVDEDSVQWEPLEPRAVPRSQDSRVAAASGPA